MRLDWTGHLEGWIALRLGGGPVTQAAALGLLHALVDASTVSAVLRTTRVVDMSRGSAFWLVVAYNLIAFGLQPAVGWISDRLRLPRPMLLLGLLLPLVALGTHAVDPYVTLACAGLGNAMFHVGAGVLVLAFGVEKTAPAGVFVGPGALGLGFGVWYGRTPTAGPLWPLAVLLGLAFALSLPWPWARASETSIPVGQTATTRAQAVSGSPQYAFVFAVVGLLLLSIAVRSLVGGAAARGCPRSVLLLLGVPTAACLGKCLGGFLADRIGWLESTSAALLVSGMLIVWGVEPTPLLLLGLLVFQTTMPVTLIAVARALPRRPGVAFGLPCLALVLGSLPWTFPAGEVFLHRPLLLGWVALALASVLSGLWLLGLRPRYVPYSTDRRGAAL
ncbi:MAG: hypothetical protein JW751_12515 [Polyangiaceae bacterium]|nr:hypothetical protein [Polyangiaceae bacterium]